MVTAIDILIKVFQELSQTDNGLLQARELLSKLTINSSGEVIFPSSMTVADLVPINIDQILEDERAQRNLPELLEALASKLSAAIPYTEGRGEGVFI